MPPKLSASKILIEAGANPQTIFTTPLRGTHPSGTVRIGEMLDQNLQTEIPGLYVCDASTFPEALARPTVLTILGLGKRLAKHLAELDACPGKTLTACPPACDLARTCPRRWNSCHA